jgi:hypothetical protein
MIKNTGLKKINFEYKKKLLDWYREFTAVSLQGLLPAANIQKKVFVSIIEYSAAFEAIYFRNLLLLILHV